MAEAELFQLEHIENPSSVKTYGPNDFLIDNVNNAVDNIGLRNVENNLVNFSFSYDAVEKVLHKGQPMNLISGEPVFSMAIREKSTSTFRANLLERIANFYGYGGSWYNEIVLYLNQYFEIVIYSKGNDVILPFPNVVLRLNKDNLFVDNDWTRCQGTGQGFNCITVMGEAEFKGMSLTSFNFVFGFKTETRLDHNGFAQTFINYDQINVLAADLRYQYSFSNNVCVGGTTCTNNETLAISHSVSIKDELILSPLLRNAATLSKYLNIHKVQIADVISHDPDMNRLIASYNIPNGYAWHFITRMEYENVGTFLVQGIRFLNNCTIKNSIDQLLNKTVAVFFTIAYLDGVKSYDEQYYYIISHLQIPRVFSKSPVPITDAFKLLDGLKNTNYSFETFVALEKFYYLDNSFSNNKLRVNPKTLAKNFSDNGEFAYADLFSNIFVPSNLRMQNISDVYTLFYYSSGIVSKQFVIIFMANDGSFYRLFNLMGVMNTVNYRCGFVPRMIDDKYYLDVHLGQIKNGSQETQVYRIPLGFDLDVLYPPPPVLEKIQELIPLNRMQFNNLICYSENLSCNPALTKV